jgi:hypothetical protein
LTRGVRVVPLNDLKLAPDCAVESIIGTRRTLASTNFSLIAVLKIDFLNRVPLMIMILSYLETSISFVEVYEDLPFLH